MRTATITINPTAFAHNIQRVSELAPHSRIMVMLKANAYGHGLDVCTLSLLNNQQVQAIGVATMEEGLQVRKLGWQKDIVLIEGVFSHAEWQTAIRYQLQCVIHHQQQLDWALQTLADMASPTGHIWLKYNTGMNRLGFADEDILPIAKQLNSSGYHIILTSHFANADDKHHPLNDRQGELFSNQLCELRSKVDANIQGSLCNSAGIVNFPQWHYDWVRAGIMTYGSSPIIEQTANELDLQPVMTFSAKIIAIHDIKVGEMVGYGSRWTAKQPSRIAIISIGYGDGYPRVVDDTAFVAVIDSQGNLHPCPIIGRVAMDMTVIDLTHLIKTENETAKETEATETETERETVTATIGIDATVILWGSLLINTDNDTTPASSTLVTPHTVPHVDEIAKSSGTIGYELLCRLTTRPTRVIH